MPPNFIAPAAGAAGCLLTSVIVIRFAVAGLLLLPYALKKGLALDRASAGSAWPPS
jgi:hypothetical protein